jgi:hypothetical protein
MAEDGVRVHQLCHTAKITRGHVSEDVRRDEHPDPFPERILKLTNLIGREWLR